MRRLPDPTREQVTDPERLQRYLREISGALTELDNKMGRPLQLEARPNERPDVLSGVKSGSAAVVQLGLDQIATKKSNLFAIVDPTANDDNSLGYDLGSVWINISASPDPKVFVCLRATTTAAFWQQLCCSAGGGGSDLTAPPVSTSFTWRNQGSSTRTDSSNIFVGSKKVTGWRILAPTSAGNNLRILEITPPSPPYVYTAAIIPILFSQDSYRAGLVFVETGTGEVVAFGAGANATAPTLAVQKFDNVTTFNSTYKTVNIDLPPTPLLWMRIQDDSTNRKCFFSTDGDGWLEFHSVGRTDFLTANRVGVFINVVNSSDPGMVSLVHWLQT